MERRLVAILAADVVGYSRLMGKDEVGTHAGLQAHRRELIDPMVAKHHGRIVKQTGDGVLVEFASVVNAVECAIGIQRAMSKRNRDVPEDRRMEFRIGINLGVIIVEEDDIYGDGVNIAARLQEVAAPGSIAVSDAAYMHLSGKIDLTFDNTGEHKLKNIANPVRVWQWMTMETIKPLIANPSFIGKPSVAVLPFANMSDDRGQDHFADGIAEDLITALSRSRSLFVIARNSSFTYKGRAIAITLVARELGVRYVVQGSVRKAGNRVRINVQLVEPKSGNHLWADRFEGSLDDVFNLQDQITEQIVIAVEPEIAARERRRVQLKRPESLDAWELVQRGLSHLYRLNKTEHIEARRLFRKAIALDPDFAAAHAYLGFALWTMVPNGYAEDTAETIALARAAAERAVSLDPNEPVAHFSLGRLHLFAGEIEMAIDEMQTTIAINPNHARGYFGLGLAYHDGYGQVEQALPNYDAALRLSPRDPSRWRPLMAKGSALRFLGRHDEAIAWCRKACQLPDSGYMPHMHLAAALAEVGQKSAAQAAVAKAMQIQPALSIGFIRSNFVGAHETSLKSLLASLRKAGVPE